jgi:DNA-binding NtrC family response regulator
MNSRFLPKTSVVLAMASQDPALEEIQEQLEQLDVAVNAVVTLQQFQQSLQRDQAPEVVITGVSLPDGNWCDVLASTVRAGSAARVLVCSRDADERFWSEAIWRGVYDILVAPFTLEYLERSLDLRPPMDSGNSTDDPAPDRAEDLQSQAQHAMCAALVLTAVA